ncbi:aspartate aminotransferase [Toxoplasma gondii ME49]|uniref:Aspartate aminotransferase n=6 Tax=Toxoplasma gondii TaxID=5811 RepID=A0A125YKR6_TOXGV|nr:aspartate aminotransferase [Toxoplasma gondii ME49]EPT25025.1 aspartate aminotransferase [Toxoplasma gondii ME49]ESS34268.1 aspartate aminotransferase [Toxoplasma gondii VEG]KYF49746.1 aspartate aminotransferase [Toxoplasma gondii ARI]|eukprot:XP_002367206.2 aspartate aminotransferase [Toxoplasma gondii ME49]
MFPTLSENLGESVESPLVSLHIVVPRSSAGNTVLALSRVHAQFFFSPRLFFWYLCNSPRKNVSKSNALAMTLALFCGSAAGLLPRNVSRLRVDSKALPSSFLSWLPTSATPRTPEIKHTKRPSLKHPHARAEGREQENVSSLLLRSLASGSVVSLCLSLCTRSPATSLSSFSGVSALNRGYFSRTMATQSSLFDGVQEAPPDPILGLEVAFRADQDPRKVNLGIGAYRTDDGKPYVFRCVRQVEQEMAADPNLYKEYLPIDGLPELKKQTQELLFGEDSSAIAEERICSAQVLSGTGGLRVAGEFLRYFLPHCKTVYMSEPTWPNHPNIFKKAGLEVATYPYWNPATKGVDFENMKKTLESAAPYSVLLLHACAHNPTGVDLNEAQWREIMDLCKRKRLVPMIDNAYQGYASGDLQRDSFSSRLFCNEGNMELFVCQSFAKNMGLYGERIGMLHIVCANAERAKVVLSQVKKIIRPMYSSPPLHGARIVSRVLGDPNMKAAWMSELKELAGRIQSVRSALRSGLEAKQTPGTWRHITEQIGMFSYTGLSREQAERMTKHWHVYMMNNGRISLAGLTQANLPYVVEAIDEVVRAVPAS